MKFLADMGISLQTVMWLRKQGHEVVHLREEGLQRLPDEGILSKARSEKRIVLTMDLDFGYLMSISKELLPSIILFRLEDERSEVINNQLANILVQCKKELEVGSILSINETAIRVRHLPI